MLTLRLAWRSFSRHRRRSILTGLALALGLAMMLLSVGMANGAHERMVELGIRMGAGHVIVQGEGYREERDLDAVVEDPGAVVAAAEPLESVRHVVPRVRASGLLSAGAASVAVGIAGVDPRIEREVSEIASDERRVEGHYLRSRDQLEFESQPGDVYVGAQLADNLDLELGDRVVLTVSPRGGGQPRSAAFLVRGVFRTGLAEIDGFAVQIALDEAQTLLELGPAVTEVALILDGDDDVEPVAAALQAALADAPGLEVLPWQEALRELYEAIVIDDAGMYLMMIVVFVIVGIGIFNTVLMSVVERTRELGVMMAIGTSARRLFAQVMAEAALLTVIGCAVGLALGLSIHGYVATEGIDVQQILGDKMNVAGVLIEGRMYSHLSASSVATWTAVIAGIVMLSALYPAYRAARLEPIEAMRHV